MKHINKLIIMNTTKFFNFSQNNSVGYFIYDDIVGICEEVIVEADNAKNAWSKMKSILDSSSKDVWSYCSCCGERWSSWINDNDGKKVPSIYGTPIDKQTKELYMHFVYVHYLDGTFKKVDFLDKD